MKYLIVGLGNIGPEYIDTRHNIGFEVVDCIAEQYNCAFELDRHAFITDFKFKGRSFYLLKPTTYMNLSGKAVRYWKDKLNINQDNLLVVLDDLALPFGKIRLKPRGSDGGHNGLKSINELLSNNNYPRLRFGIGSEFSKGTQVNYVLGKWEAEEEKELPNLIKKSSDAIISFATIGMGQTMNQFNG